MNMHGNYKGFSNAGWRMGNAQNPLTGKETSTKMTLTSAGTLVMFSISCIRVIVWLLHNSCLFKSHFPQVPYKYKCWLDQNDPIAYVPWQSDSLVTSTIDCTFESGHLVLKTILPLPLYSKLPPLTNQGEAGGLTAINLWHQQAIFFRRDKQILTHWTNWSGQQALWSYSHKKLDLPVLLMRDPHCKMVWKHC